MGATLCRLAGEGGCVRVGRLLGPLWWARIVASGPLQAGFGLCAQCACKGNAPILGVLPPTGRLP